MKKEAINQLAGHLTKSMLTPDMRMVADVVGMREAFMMSVKLGGIRVHIPCLKNVESSKDGKLLMQALEAETLQALCAELPGVNISIPMVQSLSKRVFPAIIRQEFNGENSKELALKYDISQRAVEGYVSIIKRYQQKKHKKESIQL